MGIPKFFSWFSKNYPFSTTVSEGRPKERIDFFAIDLNGIIHPAAGEVMNISATQMEGGYKINEMEFMTRRYAIFPKVFEIIVKLTQAVKPCRALMIAVDGVAPQAKINQQRNRRYKSAAVRKPDAPFDSNAITPGTTFMMELDIYLQAEFQKVKDQKLYSDIFPPTVVYSSQLVPGEGEHKIADYLREVPSNNQTAMIHGADADLIMIYSLLLEKDWKNIYLFRNNTDKYEIETVVNLRSLETVLKSMYPEAVNPIDDFVVIIFLIGNDFLPHFPSFERVHDALNTLVAGYSLFLKANPGRTITDGSGIQWENFGAYLKFIRENYDAILLKLWAENTDAIIKFPSAIAESCVESVPIIGRQNVCQRTLNISRFSQLWYIYAFSSKSGGKMIVPTEADKDSMIHHYLEGIAWVYNYYKYGVSRVNVGWYYPYHYSPLFSDLDVYIEKHPISNWMINPTYLRAEFVSPLVQLVMVIPPKSKTVIPEQLWLLYTEASPIYDLFPETFRLDNQGKMEEWQSTAILPMPQVERVILSVSQLGLTQRMVDVYRPRENLFFERSLIQSLKEHPYCATDAPRGRGRGTYVPRGESRGRGSPRGESSRGRGSYAPRSRGPYMPRGRSEGRGRGRSAPRGNF